MIIPHETRTTSACSERTRENLGEVLVSKMSFKTPAVLESVLGKSSAIPVSLSES